MRNQPIVLENDKTDAKRVLDAAGLTCVAAALMAVTQLIRYVLPRNRGSIARLHA